MPKGLKGLIPFLTFLSVYISVGIWHSLQGTEFAFYQFPAATCALMGFGVALIINYKNSTQSIETFIRGIAEENVIIMCLIFLLGGAFSVVTQKMGAVDNTVNLGLSLLPAYALLPGIFFLSCVISFAMGTAMGTIGAILPIAIGLADKSGLDLALTVGSVVGGSMFGDNLSILSDTTIAATSTQGCSMKDKMKSNFKIAFPAAVFVMLILSFISKPELTAQVYDYSFVKTLPYLLVIALALLGWNVITVLMISLACSGLIGALTGSLTFIQFGKACYEGFLSMNEVFFLTFLSAGLAALAIKEGTLEYLFSKLEKYMTSKKRAEFGIASIVSLADICIANNTVAIIVTGPMVKNLSEKFGIRKERAASLLDIFSCVWQGLIPYGAQILLAGNLSKLSPFKIVLYTWYPMVLGVFVCLSILFARKQTYTVSLKGATAL